MEHTVSSLVEYTVSSLDEHPVSSLLKHTVSSLVKHAVSTHDVNPFAKIKVSTEIKYWVEGEMW